VGAIQRPGGTIQRDALVREKIVASVPHPRPVSPPPSESLHARQVILPDLAWGARAGSPGPEGGEDAAAPPEAAPLCEGLRVVERRILGPFAGKGSTQRGLVRKRLPIVVQRHGVAVKRFGVSKEAAAKTYASYHEQPIAMVVVKDGRFERAQAYHLALPSLTLADFAALAGCLLNGLRRERRRR